MRLSVTKVGIVLLAGFVLIALSTESVSTAQRPMPNPWLNFIGQEPFKVRATEYTRYSYEIANRAEYPNALFAAAPELPPCGSNAKSARTWIDIYDQSGKRLNGFCALASNGDLSSIWFALESDVVPPSWVYIEFNDRKTNTKYKSNLAETTL